MTAVSSVISRTQSLVLGLVVGGLGLTPLNAAEFDCIIEPSQVLELRSPYEGLIESVEVQRGDLVEKGQVLAVLDTSVDEVTAAIAKYRSQMTGVLQAAETRVEFTRRRSVRATEMHYKNFISEEVRDETTAEMQLAIAELADAQDNRRLAALEYERQMEIIGLKTITSPINGVIMERILNPGELAEAGVGRVPLMKIAEIELLYVEVLLPVQVFTQVERGMEVVVIPEAPVGARYNATVEVVDRVIDSASGTFVVRLNLPNPDYEYLAGVSCLASFTEIVAAPRP